MSNNPELVAGVFGDINEANYGLKARPLAENAFRAMLGDKSTQCWSKKYNESYS